STNVCIKVCTTLRRPGSRRPPGRAPAPQSAHCLHGRRERPVPATIRDVARACGVHVSTVSRTFSAPNLVNPETRSRVLAVAEQLGYRPNKAARALITGRTTNLGLIVADI